MAIADNFYRLMLRCRDSVLAKVHFWGHNIGLPILMVSLAMFLNGVKSAEKVVAVGSIVGLLSLLLFTLNLFCNGSPEPGKLLSRASE